MGPIKRVPRATTIHAHAALNGAPFYVQSRLQIQK
jgi:hypothetical protein